MLSLIDGSQALKLAPTPDEIFILAGLPQAMQFLKAESGIAD